MKKHDLHLSEKLVKQCEDDARDPAKASAFDIQPGPFAALDWVEALEAEGRKALQCLRAIDREALEGLPGSGGADSRPPSANAWRILLKSFPVDTLRDLAHAGNLSIAAAEKSPPADVREWPPPVAINAVRDALLAFRGGTIDLDNEDDAREVGSMTGYVYWILKAQRARNDLLLGVILLMLATEHPDLMRAMYKHHSTLLRLHGTETRRTGGREAHERDKIARDRARAFMRERWESNPTISGMARACMRDLPLLYKAEGYSTYPCTTWRKWAKELHRDLGLPRQKGRPSKNR